MSRHRRWLILLGQHPAVKSPAEASAGVLLDIGSPSSLGLPAVLAGDTLSRSVEAPNASARLARNISRLRSGLTDFCNDVGTVNSCRTQANPLRRQAGQKSAPALVDVGNVTQKEADWSSLSDRLCCTGLDRIDVLARQFAVDRNAQAVLVRSKGVARCASAAFRPVPHQSPTSGASSVPGASRTNASPDRVMTRPGSIVAALDYVGRQCLSRAGTVFESLAASRSVPDSDGRSWKSGSV